jgi:multidrug resistance efflux pump
MGKDSMFYDDAKRHMSRRMRHNIDNFEKSLKDYNDYVNSNNPIIDNGINGIISKPVYGKLTSDQISSIYSVIQIAFSQAIKGADDVETAIKKWDLAAKLRTSGFNTQSEIDNVKSILAAIEQDQNTMDRIKELKSKINNLVKQQDIIKSQSKEISDQIQHNRYRGQCK